MASRSTGQAELLSTNNTMSCADWVCECECDYREKFRGAETEKRCPKCGRQMFCEFDEWNDHHEIEPEDEDDVN